jgi:putative phage-type endonuclease
MKTHEVNVEQRTPEWFAARAGCVTGSAVSNVLAKIKTGEAAVRSNYRMKLAVERLTHQPQESGFVNDAMRWGIEQEKYARSAYEAKTGVMVRECGFIRADSEFVGFSPDGLIADDGLLEIKCPNSVTHLATIEAGTYPSEYRSQIQMGLWVTGRQWCDFVSFDPRFPGHLQLFVLRVERDEDYIKSMSEEVNLFNDEVSQLVNRMEKK